MSNYTDAEDFRDCLKTCYKDDFNYFMKMTQGVISVKDKIDGNDLKIVFISSPYELISFYDRKVLNIDSNDITHPIISSYSILDRKIDLMNKLNEEFSSNAFTPCKVEKYKNEKKKLKFLYIKEHIKHIKSSKNDTVLY